MLLLAEILLLLTTEAHLHVSGQPHRPTIVEVLTVRLPEVPHLLTVLRAEAQEVVEGQQDLQEEVQEEGINSLFFLLFCTSPV